MLLIFRRDSRRSVTPACRGRVGIRPLANVEEETPMSWSGHATRDVHGQGRDDPNGGMPWGQSA